MVPRTSGPSPHGQGENLRNILLMGLDHRTVDKLVTQYGLNTDISGKYKLYRAAMVQLGEQSN